MKIRPLHDRVIVKRVAEQEKSGGGIIILDTAKEKPLEGLVGVEHLMLRADDLLAVIEEGTVNV